MILIEILIFDKLILMDDVSGLADKSEDFVNCLTMSQNLTLLAYMFFIRCIRRDITGT